MKINSLNKIFKPLAKYFVYLDFLHEASSNTIILRNSGCKNNVIMIFARASFICFFVLFIFLGCPTKSDLKKTALTDSNADDEAKTVFLLRNRINLENGIPFYIIKQHTLLLSSSYIQSPVSKNTLKLGVGDIVCPVIPYTEQNGHFMAVSIDKKYSGWINLNDGISLDFSEDKNLYFFSDTSPEYYLSKYKETNGVPTDSYKVILLKNIIPMLLGNFKTKGWFYQDNPLLALSLSKYCVSIAKDQNTFFYASTMYDDWKINELVIAMNLLSDSYQKMGCFAEAADIQNTLIKKHFWKRSDNTQTGGLNSIVKLEKIYIDWMLQYKKGSALYEKYKELLIDTILLMDDRINYFTIMDSEWHQTASEWLIDILERKLEPDEFINFCDTLCKKTASDGYADLITVHKAIKMYKTGQKEEAMKIFTSFRSKNKLMRYLNINDWLSDMQIIPDSILYKYDRF